MPHTVVTIEPSPVAGKRILMINAGSRKKRVTFEEALRLGLSITLVHPGARSYADAYCDDRIDSTGKSGEEVMAEILSRHGERPFDGVITFLEEDVEFAAEVAQRLGCIGISPETAQIARNKFLMRERLAERHVPAPRAALVLTMNEAKEAAARIGYPVVLKPFKGTDSMWVSRINTEQELEKTFADVSKYAKHPYEAIVPVETKKYVIESYMAGSEVSAEVLIQHGEARIVGIIDKLPMIEPFFIERGDLCPSRLPAEVQHAIRSVAEATVRALDMKNGIAHIELKVTEDGPKVIEIAARMGGDYICDWIETIFGVNLAREALLIALGAPSTAMPSRPRKHLRGEYFIPEEDCMIKDVSGIQEIERIERSPFVHHLYIWAHKGDQLLVPPRGFDTAGWVVVSGKTSEEADAHMTEVRGRVHIEYEPLSKHKGDRTDIIQSSLRQHIARPQMPEQVTLSVCTDMAKVRDLWAMFASGGNPFLDWEFREAFAVGYGQERMFLLAEDATGQCVGMLPLQYATDRNQWEFFGSHWFEENIFFAKNEQVLRQLLAAAPRPLFLNGIDHRELSRFQSLPLDFEGEKYLLPLPPGMSDEHIFDSLSSHRRSVIRRKLKKTDALNLRVSTDPWPEAMDALIALNMLRFGASHSFTPSRAEAFRRVFARNYTHLTKRVVSLWDGERLCAVGFALHNGVTYVCLNAGWDIEQYPHIEAALTMESIRDAIRLGCTTFDALSNDYGWKNYWGLSAVPLYCLAIEKMDEPPTPPIDNVPRSA